jgi:hypothetical protein
MSSEFPPPKFRCAEAASAADRRAQCARHWHRLRFTDLGKIAIFRPRGTAATYRRHHLRPCGGHCFLALRTRLACHRARALGARLAGGILNRASRPRPESQAIPVHAAQQLGFRPWLDTIGDRAMLLRQSAVFADPRAVLQELAQGEGFGLNGLIEVELAVPHHRQRRGGNDRFREALPRDCEITCGMNRNAPRIGCDPDQAVGVAKGVRGSGADICASEVVDTAAGDPGRCYSSPRAPRRSKAMATSQLARRSMSAARLYPLPAARGACPPAPVYPQQRQLDEWQCAVACVRLGVLQWRIS